MGRGGLSSEDIRRWPIAQRFANLARELAVVGERLSEKEEQIDELKSERSNTRVSYGTGLCVCVCVYSGVHAKFSNLHTCECTVYTCVFTWHKQKVQCTATVYCYSVLLQCTATVYCYSVLLQCTATVYCYSVLLQCTATVYCYSVLLQCTTTVYYYCVLTYVFPYSYYWSTWNVWWPVTRGPSE